MQLGRQVYLMEGRKKSFSQEEEEKDRAERTERQKDRGPERPLRERERDGRYGEEGRMNPNKS